MNILHIIREMFINPRGPLKKESGLSRATQNVFFTARRPIRLAVVATHAVPYQVPLWRMLARLPELEVHVYFGSDFGLRSYRDPGFGIEIQWDMPLTDGYEHTFLSSNRRLQVINGFFSLRPVNLARRLREFGPDCVLVQGYMPFFWWETFWIVRAMGIPLLMRAETTDVAKYRTRAKSLIRNLFLRFVYSQCTQLLAIGCNAREHYLSKGVTPERIGWSPYCTNTDMIEEQFESFRMQRKLLRKDLGFSDAHTVFIYAAKLIPKKDPLTLVRALQSMSEAERSLVGLIVMGDGELWKEFEEECRKALGSRLAMVGFVNQSQMGRYYAAADCLVLPSIWGETWGVVVNEAMQFGLPAIVSDRVGCHPDLVVEGKTGYVFPAGDAVGMSACLTKVKDLLLDREATSEACRLQVSRYSVKEAVEGLLRGVSRVAELE